MKYVNKLKYYLCMLALVISTSCLAALPAAGTPGSINDPRYCGEPVRDASGRIKRSQALLKKFTAVFPCPSTLRSTSSCSGWAIDHTIPLASGGCDSIANLTWLPDAIKSCSDDACKDRWERKYNAIPRQMITIPVSPDAASTVLP